MSEVSMQEGLREAISFTVKMGGKSTGYTVFLKTWMLKELCSDMSLPFDPDMHGQMHFGKITAQIMDNLRGDKALILMDGVSPHPNDLEST